MQLSLLNPIRQGQTRYQFLVMQFDREEEITAELNMEECACSQKLLLMAKFDATGKKSRNMISCNGVTRA